MDTSGKLRQGCLGGWQTIFQFALNAPIDQPLIICIDEICKAGGSTSYEVIVRTEIFRLLDLQVPPGVCDHDDTPFSPSEVKVVEKALAERTLILATAAFQGLLETKTKTPLGFGKNSSNSCHLNPHDIGKIISPELALRSRSRYIQLPSLTRSNYEVMIETASETVAPYLQSTFRSLAHQKLEYALSNHIGARFLGEILLDTVVSERRMVRNSHPEQATSPSQSP